MKRKLTAGQTSVSLPIFVQDTSSTTGGGLSGLTSGTSGLVAEYRRRGQSSWTAITLTSKTLGTWTSGGIVADGALAGAYELDLPDAVCASGARWVAVRLRGAANMLPCLIEIELDACDYQVDALGAVKPTTAGRTLTVDTSGFVTVATNNDKTGYSLTQSFPANFASMAITVSGAVTAGTVSDKTGYSLTPTTGLGNQTANITGNLSGSVGSVTGNVGGNVVGSVASVTNRVTANTDQWNGVTVTGMPMPTYTQPTGFLAATFPSTVASTTNITAASGVSLSAGSISSIQSGLATAANQSTLIDYAGYTLSVLSGAVTGAQTSSETYAIALGGSTYTVAMAGLTSTGTRTAPTLTKT